MPRGIGGRQVLRHPKPEEGAFDPSDPGNVSPFVAYLATDDCPIKGKVFYVAGGTVGLFQPFAIVERIQRITGKPAVLEAGGETFDAVAAKRKAA